MNKKKILSALFLAIILVGASYAMRIKNGKIAPKNDGALASIVEAKVKQSYEADTDGDGLKNWEEAFYGTDPENPDTDGDGIGDKAQSSSKIGSGISTSSVASQELTATDRLSQDVFSLYLSARNSGREIDEDLTEEIAAKIISQDYTEDSRIYGEKDIKVAVYQTASALKNYGNALGSALTPPAPDVEEEIVIFERIQTEPSSQYDDALNARISRYKKIERDVLAIAAPKELVPAVVKMANGIHVLRESVEGALRSETDPIGALVRIGQYENGLKLLDAGVLEARIFFKGKGVSFTAYESGYLFGE